MTPISATSNYYQNDSRRSRNERAREKRVKLCSKESSSSTETRSKSSQSWQIMWKRLIKLVIGGITRGVPPSPFLCMISPYKVQCLGEKKGKSKARSIEMKGVERWQDGKWICIKFFDIITHFPPFLAFTCQTI